MTDMYPSIINIFVMSEEGYVFACPSYLRSAVRGARRGGPAGRVARASSSNVHSFPRALTGYPPPPPPVVRRWEAGFHNYEL
jgi:hypothetical protein